MTAWSMGVCVAMLDSNLASVALPAIAHDLGASSAASIWVINAAQIAAAVCVLPASALADSIGYKRIFLAGLSAVFLGSVLSALAPTLTVLILARVLSGLANGCIFSLVGAFLRVTYPPDQIGKGLSWNAALISLCIGATPAIAAGILSFASWRWLFFLTPPFSLLSLLLARRLLVDTPRRAHRWDLVSTLLNAATFALFIIGVHGFSHGGSPLSWAALAGSVVAGYVFVRRQITSPAPMLGVDLLKIPLVAMSIVTMAFCFVAQTMTFISLPFFVFGRGPADTAILLSAWPLASFAVSPIAGKLADRHSAGLLGGIGMSIFAAGVLALYFAPQTASVWDLAARVTLCGIGFNLFGPPNYRGILIASPAHRAGAAGGMTAASRTLSQSTGAALAAVIFGVVADGRATPESIGAVFLTSAALAAVGAIISLSRTKLR